MPSVSRVCWALSSWGVCVLSHGIARGNSEPEKYLESHNHKIWAYQRCRMNWEFSSHPKENPTLMPVLAELPSVGWNKAYSLHKLHS